MTTLLQALKLAEKRLDSVSSSARLDAECLLCEVIKQTNVYLRTWPEKQLSEQQQGDFYSLLQRREQGEPIAYILEKKEFWSLDLKVSSDTLIPRPDTELLVEQVLEFNKIKPLNSILELGTGSGAIAIAIASELSLSHVGAPKITAIDRSVEALKIAQQNKELHQLDINFIESDWFSALKPQRFDLIVSNPPYIEVGDEHLSQGDVQFEPVSALVSGEDGLDDIRSIIIQAKQWLNPNGYLVLEHGYQQGERVREIFKQNGYLNATTKKDLAQHDRISFALSS